MRQREITAIELSHEAYYIAKGVRKLALFDTVLRREDDLLFWQQAMSSSIGYFARKHRGCYPISCYYKVTPWVTETKTRQVIQIVIYRLGCEKEADRLINLVGCERGPEDTKELGLLLGYAPELVEEFVYG